MNSPKHVAIIMDGNGRWGIENKKSRNLGHKAVLKTVEKIIKSMGEKCKISIRNIRREGNDELKKLLKNKEISEDDVKKNEKIIQDHTDKNINEIDQKVISKEK